MRGLAAALLTGALAAATMPAARAADLAAGLVGYWKLDETAIGAATAAVDSSPTHADGVYQGSPTSDAPAPAVQSDPGSVLFSRADTQAVRVTPVPAELKPPAVTLAAWFRVRTALPPNGTNGQADVVSIGDQVMLRVYASKVGTAKRIAGNAWVPLDVGATAGPGEWHHMAATVDGAAMAVYFDGAMVGTMADANPISYDLTTADLWIARFGGGSGRDFDGNVDEVAIWSRVLAPEEIAALAAGAQPGGVPATPSDATTDGGGTDAVAPSDAGAETVPSDAGALSDGASVEARYHAEGSRPPAPAAGCACATAPGSPGAAVLLAAALVLALGRRCAHRDPRR